jgi:hypothetical protein
VAGLGADGDNAEAHRRSLWQRQICRPLSMVLLCFHSQRFVHLYVSFIKDWRILASGNTSINCTKQPSIHADIRWHYVNITLRYVTLIWQSRSHSGYFYIYSNDLNTHYTRFVLKEGERAQYAAITDLKDDLFIALNYNRKSQIYPL